MEPEISWGGWEYPKIHSLFKREAQKPNKLIIGDWAKEEFAYLQNNEWEFTEKVDGTNIRISLNTLYGRIEFGGRTENANIPAKLVSHLEEIFFPQAASLLNWAGEHPSSPICFYGEGYGAGIQALGKKYRATQDFILFDIRIGNYWLQRDSLKEIAARFSLDLVPVIRYGNLWEGVREAQEGFKSFWGDFSAEGLVARPRVRLKDGSGGRIITKIKTKDFI